MANAGTEVEGHAPGSRSARTSCRHIFLLAGRQALLLTASWRSPLGSRALRPTARRRSLYCVATAVMGIDDAIGLHYRIAAAEEAMPGDRAKAISLVLAGRTWFSRPFLGSFVLLSGVVL